MKHLKFSLLLGLLSCIFSCYTQQSAFYQASVTINTNAPSKTYNPMIFGGFIEHFGKQIYGGVFDPGSLLSDENGFRTDVIEALNELKVPVIRWPGGCFVDGYHWMNGVGNNRQSTDDIRWGVIEPNTFGTHEFIELIDKKSFSINFFETFRNFALSLITLVILFPFIVPGQIALTLILNLPSSIAIVFVIPIIAHLLAA